MDDSFPYRAEFVLTAEKEALRAAYYSLLPETGRSGRTLVEMRLTERRLILLVSAADAVALRAGVNSYLRWLNEALTVYETSMSAGKSDVPA